MPAKNIVEVIIKGTNDASDELEDVSKSGVDLSKVLSVAAVAAAAKATYELGKLGAQSIRTKNAFVAISGGAEEAAANLAAMEKATRGALSEQDAMAAASRLLQMGLVTNSQELGNMTEMAVRLGTAMGRDANASIEEFALLLANQSIPRLDTFGISAGKVRARINELMKANKNLSRETAFMTAVNEQGAIAMGRLGDAAEDEALAFERAEASAEDLKASLGRLVAGPVSDMVSFLGEGVETLELLVTWNEKLDDVYADQEMTMRRTATNYDEYARGILAANGIMGDDFDLLLERYMTFSGDMEASLDRMVEEYGGLARAELEAANKAEELTQRFGEAIDVQEEGIEATSQYAIAIGESAAAADEAAPLFGGLADSVIDVGKAFMDGIPSTNDMWNLVLQTGTAAGMTAEQLGDLAVAMGVAEQSEIQAQLAALEVVSAWDAGDASARRLIQTTGLLEKHTREAEEAKRLESEANTALDEGNIELAESLFAQAEEHRIAAENALEMAITLEDETEKMETATDTSDDLSLSVLNLGSAHRDTAVDVDHLSTRLGEFTTVQEPVHKAAKGMTDDLERFRAKLEEADEELEIFIEQLYAIPTDIDIKIRISTETSGGVSEYQEGTMYHPGGAALVGEAGPELVVLPQGAQVIPNQNITNYEFNMPVTTVDAELPFIRQGFETMRALVG